MAQQTAYQSGSTGVSVEVEAFTISTGVPITTLTSASSGLVANYWRGPDGAVTTFTLVGVHSTGSWTSGGFVHKSGGVYRVDVPNAALAAGADYVAIKLAGVTDCYIDTARIDLVGVNPRSAAPVSSDLTTGSVSTVVSSVFARTYDATKMAGLTFEELTALMASAIMAKVTGMDTNVPQFRNVGDSALAISASTDAYGNRSTVVLNKTNVR